MNPIDRFLFWLHRKRCADCKEWWDFQKFTVPAYPREAHEDHSTN